MEGIVGYLAAFLVGALSGAAGQYLATRFTEKRHAKESKATFSNQMDKVQEAMPELLEEMVADFASQDGLTIREIVLLPNERVMFNTNKQRFVYFESKHRNLRGKIDILEQYGLVEDITFGNTPIYRLSKEFHAYLRPR